MILLYRPVYRPYLDSILFSNRSLNLTHTYTHTHNLYVALSPATRVAILSVLKINLYFQKETDVTYRFITIARGTLFFIIFFYKLYIAPQKKATRYHFAFNTDALIVVILERAWR